MPKTFADLPKEIVAHEIASYLPISEVESFKLTNRQCKEASDARYATSCRPTTNDLQRQFQMVCDEHLRLSKVVSYSSDELNAHLDSLDTLGKDATEAHGQHLITDKHYNQIKSSVAAWTNEARNVW